MNFINPFISLYFRPTKLYDRTYFPFENEIFWGFLKNLDNRLGLYRHRVNIVFVNDEVKAIPARYGSIFEYEKKFDKAWGELREQSKRKLLLDIVYEAFTAIGKKFDWDLDVIEDAYIKSITEVGQFKYVTASKNNRSKTLSGQIRLVLTGRELTISAIITDNKNDSEKIFRLLTTDEDTLSWEQRIRKFGWYDNQKFGLKFLSGDLWILINVDNGQIQEIKTPKKASIEKIEKYLIELKGNSQH